MMYPRRRIQILNLIVCGRTFSRRSAPSRKGSWHLVKKIILEVSVENLGGAQAAERGGAQRLELCDDLSAGGITPNEKLMSEVRAAVKVPIFSMVRPRSGGFVYTAAEFSEMKRSIAT